MAQIVNSSGRLRRIALSGVALAALFSIPGIAAAQDGGRQGGERGQGQGARVYQGRGDRIGQLQQQRHWQQQRQWQQQAQSQGQAQAPAAPPTSRAQRVDNWRGGDGRQQYRGMGNGPDAQRWTQQQEAYRRSVRNDAERRPSTWQTDRDDRRDPAQWQGQRNLGWQGDRGAWQNDHRNDQWRGDRGRGAEWRGNDGGRGNNGREAWRNNGGWNAGRSDNRAWDRSWRSNDRYDWSSYRARNRNIFQAGRYYSPYQNYSYRRLSIGVSLGSPFYGSRYWIDDPYAYRLPETYGPYRWVRYYDDVLLVDTYTGEVVDAIYDFFW